MEAHAKQIFEYLYAVKNVTTPPIRDFEEYEFHKFLDDLPSGEGCYLYGSGNSQEAWLEVHKQQFELPPKPSEELRRWLKTNYTDERIQPQTHELLEFPTANETGEEIIIKTKFTDDQDRVRQYQQWEEKWKGWARETRRRKKIQELYSFFFTLNLKIERESESIELAIGHGLVKWKQGEEFVNHPLLVTKMELSFHAKEGMAYIKPTSTGTVLETEMISNLDIPNIQAITRLKKRIDDYDLDPLEKEATEAICKEFIHTLDPQGLFLESQSEAKGTPVVVSKTVLFLRRRSGQLVKEDLYEAVNKINEGFEVPKTIQNIVQLETQNSENDSQVNTTWKSVNDELLFPLPANEDQKEIARRLAKNFGVVVQGPPGTGKSHTIANLISHLLAHGKKVLVTSQKERPLRVLAEKLPVEIRSLCVSVLGGDSKSISEVENSIRSLTDKMSSLDGDILSKEIEQIGQQLKSVRTEIAAKKTELNKAAQLQMTKLIWNNRLLSPIDAAKKVEDERKEFGWIPDRIPMNYSFPLSDENFRTLWTLIGELSYSDRDMVNQFIPESNIFLTTSEFSSFIQQGNRLKQVTDSEKKTADYYGISLEKSSIQKYRDLFQKIQSLNFVFDEPFFIAILEDVFAGGERKETWKDYTHFLKEQQTIISKLKRSLSEYEIITAEHKPISMLIEDARGLQKYLEKNKQIGKVYLMTTGRKYKDFYETTTINQRPIRSVKDLQVILDYFTLRMAEEKIVIKWNKTLSEINGPLLKEKEERLVVKCEELQIKIEQIHQLANNIHALKNEMLSKTKLSVQTKWASLDAINQCKRIVDTANKRLDYELWNHRFSSILNEYKGLLQKENPHPICTKLIDAFQLKQVEDWSSLINELRQLYLLQQKQKQCNRSLHILGKVAPNWTHQLVKQMGKEFPFPSNWEKAWEWSQLNSWLSEINEMNVERIEEEILQLQDEERDLIKDTVVKKTWKSHLERITPSQKSALLAWKAKLKKMGAGKSKYIERYRKEARQEMKKCQSAIPVWIMPVNRVIENFAISEETFDVVIVDESSQCDLFSLAVLLRAKRAVIVGDDEQISPSAVGKNIQNVHGLIEQHLEGVPQAHTFDLQTSLYDVARRVFPGSLMLKEHFRCAPEIIQFSNDLSYSGEIIPLRIPKADERIDPPVIAIRVNGYRNDGTKAYNENEAGAIVDDIKKLLEDENYVNKTIGVISLLGKDQATFIESMLRKEIGEEEMLRRRIICGDAYDFQGDERDIIFLSMVVATNVRFNALTSSTFKQRFNVAASRAQNQMRLYHSVDLDDLNPTDFRSRLLAYCLNPDRVTEVFKNLEEKCESPFEKDVLRMIVARGYRVRPQVQAGNRRIDLVIEGIRDRLAVECDGDKFHPIEKWEEDMERQRTLERVGWKFWRVRGSEFYRHREKALRSLWERLDHMGIDPALTKPVGYTVKVKKISEKESNTNPLNKSN